MNIQNLKIGTLLRVGFGMVLFFIVLGGVFSWYETSKLWEDTDGIYHHPLQVRRNIAVLKPNLLLIDRLINDYAHFGSASEKSALISRMEKLELSAYKQVDSLSLSYLGPKTDLTEISYEMNKYRDIRQEVIALVNAGRMAEAFKILQTDGPDEQAVDKVLKEINDVSVFAFNRADKFFSDAERHKQSIAWFLLTLFGLSFAVSFLILLALLRIIKTPLDEMTRVTDDFRKGNLDARIAYSSNNELGRLTSSINLLAEVNQSDLRNKDLVGKVADVMLKEEEMHSFCHSLIMRLMEATNSQIGSVYLLNEQKTDFEPFESMGHNSETIASFSALNFEGEFGLALSSRQVQVIRNIPTDTALLFSTTAGDFRPREIISIPIFSGDEVVAMISLASLHCYPPEALRMITDIQVMLMARFNGVIAHQKILEFAEKLESQNRELDERAKELSIQSQELSEQNLELEMQKSQLDEASKLKSTFLSNMSHELRTPLNSVIALSGVLSRRLQNKIPEDEYSYIEIIERNGRNLLTLINDVLDLSRVEAGHEEVAAATFTVFELADEIVGMLDQLAKDKKISLENSVGQDLPEIRSDYGKCRHIIQNLVSNAVKFTEQGSVVIKAEQIENEMIVTVTDTGIGIPAEELPFIFDEFRQVDGSSSKKFGGTGLGLAIAKKYANLLHGEIRVESQPGVGSTFTLILPMKLDSYKTSMSEVNLKAYRRTPRPSEFHASASGSGKTILLFEDSEAAIIQITDILTEQSFTVQVARNGKEAVEQIQLFHPDAVILDLMMPEVDGFQVLKMIRETPETSKVPVLILTAKHITKEELSFLKGNNIYQFIQKGDVGRIELLATVDNMVSPRPEMARNEKTGHRLAQRKGKPLILVVEDNPDNMKTAKAILSQEYLVLEACDGFEGVQQALAHNPDLILMDMSLPVMDGFEAFDAIRKSEDHKHTPIVALTASAMKGSREDILEYGFDDYISKPIDEPMFWRVLKYYLGEQEGS